jgi:hypothetical protein
VAKLPFVLAAQLHRLHHNKNRIIVHSKLEEYGNECLF